MSIQKEKRTKGFNTLSAELQILKYWISNTIYCRYQSHKPLYLKGIIFTEYTTTFIKYSMIFTGTSLILFNFTINEDLTYANSDLSIFLYYIGTFIGLFCRGYLTRFIECLHLFFAFVVKIYQKSSVNAMKTPKRLWLSLTGCLPEKSSFICWLI